MSQRNSGYTRYTHDEYETPAWCTAALVPHLPSAPARIWEPAAGSGKMVRALQDAGYAVIGTDIATGDDFLKAQSARASIIVSNPPYSHAQAFIEHALALTKPVGGMVCMLLRCDYDSAATRQHLFGGCTQFAEKLVLTKRIRWIEGSNGSPSFNHCWMKWDWAHSGPPTLAYAPVPD